MQGASVNVQFISAEAGGRNSPPIASESYRPHFRVGDGEPLGIEFVGVSESVMPFGVAVEAKVKFLYPAQVDYSPLSIGAQFAVFEGARIVGVGVVTGLS